jgi:hypothetical protein
MKIPEMTTVEFVSGTGTNEDIWSLNNKETGASYKTGPLLDLLDIQPELNKKLYLETPKGKAESIVDNLEGTVLSLKERRGWDDRGEIGYVDAIIIAIKMTTDTEVLKELQKLYSPYNK